MPFNRDVWEGRKPLTMPVPASELVADASMLAVGWTAWNVPVVDADQHALGGVIVQIHDVDGHDDDTGEITTVRYFRCIHPFRPVTERPKTLTGAEILLPGGVQRPNRQRLGTLIKLLCRNVARGDYITASDLDHLVDAYRLAAVVR